MTKYHARSKLEVEEKLLYLPPPQHDTFSPNMFVTDMEKRVQKKGIFRALFLPTMLENPFVPLGLTLTMGALGLSAYYMINDQGIKANNMLWCRIIFHSLTVVAIAGGYAYRDYKKRNKKNLTLLEALEVHE